MSNYPNGPYPTQQPGQGPYTQYPPMQPGYPPQQPVQPPKKPMRSWIIVLGFVMAAVVICFGMLVVAAVARGSVCHP